MTKIDATKIWALHYRLIMSVIVNVAPKLADFGLESKELFLLSELEEHPYPAELAATLCMPKPTVTVHVKRLESMGLVRRGIDPTDLRRHRLVLTPAGRKVLTQGLAMLSESFGSRLERLSPAQQTELKRLLEKMS